MKAIESLIQRLLELGWVRLPEPYESVSYAAPVHPVAKPTGGHRLTFDFRSLNKELEDEYYPLPLPIADMQDRVKERSEEIPEEVLQAYADVFSDEMHEPIRSAEHN